MADSEISKHVSRSEMERFCRRDLPEAELSTVAFHLPKCSDCHQQLVATLRRQRGVAALSFTLAPEFWLRHEHIDYEHLVELAENNLDATDRELIDIHLRVCTPCQDDVRSFLAFREQIAPELEVSYAPIGQKPTRTGLSWATWWRGLAWKPISAAAVVVIGIAIIVGGALLLKRRAENQQAQQVPIPQVSPGSTPDNRVANLPSPPARSNESPIERPNSAEAIVVLNDRGGTITIDKSGNVAGLDDVTPPTREEIAQVLLSERLERPAILNELGSQEGSLRGTKNTPAFKLTSPPRTVILTDRPTLRWEKASGASSYRVYVNDPAGHEVVRSEELPSEPAEWLLPKSLKRGEIYVWTVMAVINGKEILSPGPASSEMRFQVLSKSHLQQLHRLRKVRSHLALGVFYARAGMLDEAEHEFMNLSRLNPKSQVLDKLIRNVRALAKR